MNGALQTVCKDLRAQGTMGSYRISGRWRDFNLLRADEIHEAALGKTDRH
jgi:hypothetical protein